MAWKRAQVLLRPDSADVRFAGTVRADLPYRADDVFHCQRGHRRVDPACSCGFYALPDRLALPASVMTTAVLEVELEGRVVRHRTCLRAERQRVSLVTFEGWCAYCTGEASVLAGVRSSWPALPDPWLRAVPVCTRHRRLFPLTVTQGQLALATGARVTWDRASESRASRSLRRLYPAAGGAVRRLGR
ncbi:MAG TPA: hypothetical protein VHH09_02335 [Acidimicrobiales bacterium]|nr:hypothetical protein [Acidimicrobiales bacterium]